MTQDKKGFLNRKKYANQKGNIAKFSYIKFTTYRELIEHKFFSRKYVKDLNRPLYKFTNVN